MHSVRETMTDILDHLANAGFTGLNWAGVDSIRERVRRSDTIACMRLLCRSMTSTNRRAAAASRGRSI
jgi:hypothetical protein